MIGGTRDRRGCYRKPISKRPIAFGSGTTTRSSGRWSRRWATAFCEQTRRTKRASTAGTTWNSCSSPVSSVVNSGLAARQAPTPPPSMQVSRWNVRTESGPLGSGGMRTLTKRIRRASPRSKATHSRPTPFGQEPAAETHHDSSVSGLVVLAWLLKPPMHEEAPHDLTCAGSTVRTIRKARTRGTRSAASKRCPARRRSAQRGTRPALSSKSDSSAPGAWSAGSAVRWRASKRTSGASLYSRTRRSPPGAAEARRPPASATW
mmetsp:Transcript_28740/g.96850  ORF Transcript_28740/g.96850 Transcript_28740/m.96850 type:complete len:262 (+) Transcript_28740:3-788(+)